MRADIVDQTAMLTDVLTRSSFRFDDEAIVDGKSAAANCTAAALITRRRNNIEIQREWHLSLYLVFASNAILA